VAKIQMSTPFRLNIAIDWSKSGATEIKVFAVPGVYAVSDEEATAQKSKADAEKEEQDRKDKMDLDAKVAFETQRVADYTSRLAWFTLSLCFVAIAQAGLFVWQLLLIRKSATDAEEAAKLAKTTLIMTQRPRLRVRNVEVSHPPTPSRGAAPLFTSGRPMRVAFYAANIGGTPATITAALAIVHQTEFALPMRRPYEGKNGNLDVPSTKLPSGGSWQFARIDEGLLRVGPEIIGSGARQPLRLFVMGWVEYRDDNDVIRRTAFCREFSNPSDPALGRFRRVKNRDYEYEE
jgi:hypothetical protein